MGGAWTEAEGFVLSKSRRESRPRSKALARSRPRDGRSSFRRRAAHQARIGPCGAPSVGIRRAGNRPMSTNWRHAASGRARHLRAQCSTFPGMADFSARWLPCVRPDVPRCIRTAFPASKRGSLARRDSTSWGEMRSESRHEFHAVADADIDDDADGTAL